MLYLLLVDKSVFISYDFLACFLSHAPQADAAAQTHTTPLMQGATIPSQTVISPIDLAALAAHTGRFRQPERLVFDDGTAPTC